MPNLQDLIKGGIEGIGNAAGNLISKFKADPTKALEFEKEIEEFKLNAANEASRIAIEAEKVKQEEIRIELEREKAILADKANARDNNTKIQESDRASWMAKNIAYCIDAFIVLLWGVLTIYLIGSALKIIKTSQVDLTGIYGLYAAVTGVTMTIINFHRGSSVGSERKEKQMEKFTAAATK